MPELRAAWQTIGREIVTGKQRDIDFHRLRVSTTLSTTLKVDDPAGAVYYKLSAATLEEKDFPQRYLKYSTLVADPGLRPDQLAQLRHALPGRKLLAYTCMGWAGVNATCTNCTGTLCSGCPGPYCVDRMDRTGRPYFVERYVVRNLHDGRPICPFHGLGHAVALGHRALAVWIPAKDSVDAMVRFHAEVTVLGYDGLYIVRPDLPP